MNGAERTTTTQANGSRGAVLSLLPKEWRLSHPPEVFAVELSALHCPREIYFLAEGYVERSQPRVSELALRIKEHLVRDYAAIAEFPVEICERNLVLHGYADVVLRNCDGPDTAVRIRAVGPAEWPRALERPLEGDRSEANLLARGADTDRWSIVYVCDETGSIAEHAGSRSVVSIEWALDRLEEVAAHRRARVVPRCRFDGLRNEHSFCNCRRNGLA